MDQTILERFMQGDRAAFGQIIDQLQDRVYRMAWKLLGSPDMAADLTQETFIKIFEKRHQIRLDKSFEAWVMRLALNLGRDWLRRKQRYNFEPLNDHPAADPAADVCVAARQQQHQVQASLSRLLPKHREILMLRFNAELDLQQIAAVLGIPLGTVKSRLNRAVAALGKLLPKSGGGLS